MSADETEIAVAKQGETYSYCADGYSYIPREMTWNDRDGSNLYYDMLKQTAPRHQQWAEKFIKHMPLLRQVPVHSNPQGTQPFWLNDWFPPLDAIATYTIIAELQPKIYLEIGSGNSTKFARKAVDDHNLSTQIISIDPHPRAEIDTLCHQVIRQPLEDVDLSIFSSLSADDVLFLDSSHRALQNSDVTVFFTKILPIIPKGVLWGLHDIFLPYDYPEGWTQRLYNEQYLLMLYLLGGHKMDEIEMPVRFMTYCTDLPQKLHESGLGACHLDKDFIVGGAFWMRRI